MELLSRLPRHYLIVCCRQCLHSVTLLKTKEAVANSLAAAEASYKCFETKMNFESEWYVSLTTFLATCQICEVAKLCIHSMMESFCSYFWTVPLQTSRIHCYWLLFYSVNQCENGMVGQLKRSQLCVCVCVCIYLLLLVTKKSLKYKLCKYCCIICS